jgi:hypothetical protein
MAASARGEPNSLGDRAGRTLSRGLFTVKSEILFAANKRLLMTECHRKGWTVTIVVWVRKRARISSWVIGNNCVGLDKKKQSSNISDLPGDPVYVKPTTLASMFQKF